MSPGDFAEQMDRLIKTYGERSYPKERFDAIWARVRTVPQDQFQNAVTALLGDCFTPPGLTRITEEVARHRSETKRMDMAPPAFECEPCRDFGFGFDGDTVVACMTCHRGRTISPAELAKQQANYNAGARFVSNLRKAFSDLPYDHRERFEA
jgi:hypothetical protein